MLVQGFWSYSRSDAVHKGSRISALMHEIEAELGLILGDEVGLFIDTNNIRKGDKWRDSLHRALQDAAFMMPIMTPRYFKSPECRGEIMFFLESCEQLQIEPMIFPIYLVEVWGFSTKSKDPVKEQLSAFQYLDFRKLRSVDRPTFEQTVQAFCLDVLERLDATFELEKFFENEDPNDTASIYSELSSGGIEHANIGNEGIRLAEGPIPREQPAEKVSK